MTSNLSDPTKQAAHAARNPPRTKGGGTEGELRTRAKAAAREAADALAVAYGIDHPAVTQWREGSDEWCVCGESS